MNLIVRNEPGITEFPGRFFDNAVADRNTIHRREPQPSMDESAVMAKSLSSRSWSAAIPANSWTNVGRTMK